MPQGGVGCSASVAMTIATKSRTPRATAVEIAPRSAHIPAGYDALPTIRDALREDDLLFITADHGNDPTTGSSDHARENVPLLVLGDAVHPVPLGERETFADLGATVAEWLNVGFRGGGQSFLPAVERGH